MAKEIEKQRKKAVSEHKRTLILEAARRVFEKEGLDGASLRAIASEAGYTPAALYFHFESREEIYAELLSHSLANLRGFVDKAVKKATAPLDKFRAAAFSVFQFYAKRPKDLDLGFYLFKGGMTPKGVGRERDHRLNEQFADCLQPIAVAASELGADETASKRLMVDIFSYATGSLLMEHTGRIRIFDMSSQELMRAFIEEKITICNWEENHAHLKR
ncbi:MAG: TetR/AcrR family transcriptional regulator [Sneathiella sp.]|nr:TetR/AcrR family transcriptional regulator [Sneathiella sp.]